MNRPFRTILSALLLTAACSSASQANIILSFGASPPTTYTPGTPLTIDLLIDGADTDGLWLYSLKLVLSGTGVAGTDYAFGVLDPSDPDFATAGLSPTLSDLPSPSDYVFGDPDGRGVNQDLIPPLPGTDLFVTFTDFALDDPITYGGDYVARLTLVTAASYSGPLLLSFDPNDTLFLNIDSAPLDADISATLRLTTSTSGVIPEPSSLLLGLSALALAPLLRVRRRPRA